MNTPSNSTIDDTAQQLDEMLQTHIDVSAAVNSLKIILSKTMEAAAQNKEVRKGDELKISLLGFVNTSWYLIDKAKGFDPPPEDSQMILEKVIMAQAYSHLWCACQDLRTIFQESPPQVNWLSNTLKGLDFRDNSRLIMLEALSGIWQDSEFTFVEKNFEAFYEKEQRTTRQDLLDDHPGGYIKSPTLGLPINTDLLAQCLNEDLNTKFSFATDLLILFRGDVNAFLSKRLGAQASSVLGVALLSEDLIERGLFKSALKCLNSIPTPEFCEKNKEWHDNYNKVLRFTGHSDKALELRWQYFQTVRNDAAVNFYLNPLVEQINPLFLGSQEKVATEYRKYLAKIKQAIIKEHPLADAIKTSLTLARSGECEHLVDDLILHRYDHHELSNCPIFVLQDILNDLDHEHKKLHESDQAPILATLLICRTLIQREWSTHTQKSQEFHKLIDQAQQMDRKLTRTSTTQHIPSHQDFMNLLPHNTFMDTDPAKNAGAPK